MPIVQDILVHPESVKSVFEWIKGWSINNFSWETIPYVNNSAGLTVAYNNQIISKHPSNGFFFRDNHLRAGAGE